MMDDNSENYIENKVKIAVDSSKILAGYLDEVALEFMKQGVPEAYSITSELENSIIENLKALGKSTKLGTEEVVNELNKIGKPIKLVENYIEIHEDEINLMPVTFGQNRIKRDEKRYVIPTVSERLTRREGTILGGLFQFCNWVILIIPTFFLILSALSLLNQYYSDAIGFFITFAIANFLIEVSSGIRGTLYARVETVKLVRNINKNISWMAFLLMFSINLYTMNISREIQALDRSFYVWSYFLVLVCVELTYFVRDHLDGMYPLEPDFKPAVRILLLPNLLIIFGLLMFWTNITFYMQYNFWFVPNLWFSWILMAVGLITGLEKKIAPTTRLLVLTFLPSIFLLFVFGPTNTQRTFNYDFDRNNIAIQGIIWFGVIMLYFFERYGTLILQRIKESQVHS